MTAPVVKKECDCNPSNMSLMDKTKADLFQALEQAAQADITAQLQAAAKAQANVEMYQAEVKRYLDQVAQRREKLEKDKTIFASHIEQSQAPASK